MTPRALALRAGALALLALACSDRPAPKPAPPTDAAPDAAPTACTRDPDCTDGWHPQMPACGPLERCFGGVCTAPPAITGRANAETGRVVFETATGERSYDVEVVDDRFEIARGLMCRESMQRDWGMLFLMESTKVQRFWMQNTLIPLDMVFIDEGWTVVGVAPQAEPRTRTSRSVDRPSRYVLELVGGEAGRAGITAGTRARFYAPRAPTAP